MPLCIFNSDIRNADSSILTRTVVCQDKTPARAGFDLSKVAAVLQLQIQSFDLSVSRDLWVVLAAGLGTPASAPRHRHLGHRHQQKPKAMIASSL